jgi:hypothetical protein
LKENCCKVLILTIQMSHKKGRRAQPRNGFYIFSCGGFEGKLL